MSCADERHGGSDSTTRFPVSGLGIANWTRRRSLDRPDQRRRLRQPSPARYQPQGIPCVSTQWRTDPALADSPAGLSGPDATAPDQRLGSR